MCRKVLCILFVAGLTTLFAVTTVRADLVNLALAGTASQSSVTGEPNRGPECAIDGNTGGNPWDGSDPYGGDGIAHTAGYQYGDYGIQWWQVDLGAAYDLDSVVLWNRTDDSQFRLSDLNVQVLGTDGSTVVYDYYSANSNTYLNPGNALGGPTTIGVDVSGASGQYVKIIRNSTTEDNYVCLAEVQVFGVPEPGTLVIMSIGMIGLLAYAWRKRK